MFQNLPSCDSLFQGSKYLEDEVFRLLRDIAPVVVIQHYVARNRLFLYLFEEVRLKWKMPIEHEIQNDAETESINLFVVLLLKVDLWRYESWCACIFFALW
jgi:hypothetical protein